MDVDTATDIWTAYSDVEGNWVTEVSTKADKDKGRGRNQNKGKSQNRNMAQHGWNTHMGRPQPRSTTRRCEERVAMVLHERP